MTRRFVSRLVPLVAASFAFAPAFAPAFADDEPQDGTALVRTELVAEAAAVAPGEPFRVAVRFRMEPKWHIYWKNPGDSGMAPSFRVLGPEGLVISAIDWPVPEIFRTPDETTFGYSGETALVLTLTAPASAAVGSTLPIRLSAEWLVCKESCLLGTRTMELSLPVRPRGDLGPPRPEFTATLGRLPGAASDLGLEPEIRDGELVIPVRTADGATVRFLPFETRGVRFRPGPAFEAVAADGVAEIRARLKIEPDPTAAGPRTLGGLVTVTMPDGSSRAAEFTLPVPEAPSR